MKSVLIHLTDGNGLSPCVNAGLLLAARFDAKVRGVYAIPSLAASFWGSESAEFIPTLENQLRKTAEFTLTKFKELTANSSLTIDHKLLENAFLSSIAEESFGHDVMVATQLRKSPETMVEMEYQAPDLVVVSACPTLVVPKEFKAEVIGERIVIAWNNSREASRAIRDALPLLKKAQSVVVAHVSPNHHDPVTACQASEYLHNHAIPHTVVMRQSPTHAVTAPLLDIVAEHKSDLLVMGAWGHSRLRELVLGGVTREILDQLSIPALMSH